MQLRERRLRELVAALREEVRQLRTRPLTKPRDRRNDRKPTLMRRLSLRGLYTIAYKRNLGHASE
jgi:hypothetical protein